MTSPALILPLPPPVGARLWANWRRASSSRDASAQGVATNWNATCGSASAVAPGTIRTDISGVSGAGLSRRASRKASGR